MQILSHVRYLFSPRLFWYSAVLLLLSVAALWQREPTIRWTATILQLIGTLVVLNELRSALRVFGGFNWRADIAEFFRTWPRESKHTPPTSGTASLSAPMPQLVGSMHSRLPPGSPIEARMTSAEQLIEALIQQTVNIRVEIKGEAAAREKELGEATRIAEGLVTRLRDQVTEVTVGSPRMSLFGIACIAVGTFLSGTAPDWTNWIP